MLNQDWGLVIFNVTAWPREAGWYFEIDVIFYASEIMFPVIANIYKEKTKFIG